MRERKWSRTGSLLVLVFGEQVTEGIVPRNGRRKARLVETLAGKTRAFSADFPAPLVLSHL